MASGDCSRRFGRSGKTPAARARSSTSVASSSFRCACVSITRARSSGVFCVSHALQLWGWRGSVSYGGTVREPGTFAHSALMARRLVERGVRTVQILHRGWDQHGDLPRALKNQCDDTDRATAALLIDLKERGLLDETLVIWGGEFGRTVYSQGTLTRDNYGRDHHPRNFCMWLAGGGVKGGITYGETDDFSYNIADKPCHLLDLYATVLKCMGVDHERLTFRFQGRDYRLTDVEGHVVKKLLA